MGQVPKARNQALPDGQIGNFQTVTVMKKLAHQAAGQPRIQKLARLIVLQAGVPSHFYADESLAIGNYVKQHVRYSRDPEGYEQLQEPDLMVDNLEHGIAQGDCDDMALLTSALLLAIGHNPYYAMVRYEADHGPYAHIYVVDYDTNPNEGRKRVVLDCILKDQVIGSEVDSVSGDEIEV